MYRVYYQDSNESRLYSIWTTISDGWIMENVQVEKAYRFFIDLGCNEAQAEDWIRTAEHKSVRDNMKYIVITHEMLMKMAEKVE